MNDTYYNYENFNIDVNGDMLPLIIWGIYIGIMLGVLGSIICRIYSSRLIQSLMKSGAADEASAKTLAELGLGKQFVIKRMLSNEQSSLHRCVICANAADFIPASNKFKVFWHEKFLREDIPAKLDFASAKFYLPEEKRIAAELRYQVEGHPIRNFIIAAVGLFAAAFFAVYAVPELLQMLDNFITSVKPASNVL